MDILKEHRLASLNKKFEEFKEHERLNQTAVECKWRDIMAENALQDQSQNLDKIRAGYTKQLDRCDAIISRLMQWLTDGESQYQFALRAHKKNLETLQALALKRLDSENDKFEKSALTIVNEFDANRNTTLSQYNKHVSELLDITSAIEHQYDEKNKQLDAKHRAETEYLNLKNQEMLMTLKTHLFGETDAVIKASKAAFEDFKRKSEGKMQQFHQMYEKHKARQRQMKIYEQKIIKKAADIAHLRRKIRNNERESKATNDRIRQEKENLSLHFRELKEIMAKFRTTEARKLAEISVAFEDAINSVTDKLHLAEKILKYSEMTRELETEREQVMPFPPSIVETDPEIQRQMRQFKLQLKGDSKYVGESDMFDKFYRRHNKVLLEKLSLQREKEGLVQHNQRLKTMLSKYMSGMGVTPGLMSNPNTLVIVNQNTNAPLRKVDQDNIPEISAKLTVDANKLQGY